MSERTTDVRISRWALSQVLVLGVFLVGHLGAFVWWSGRMTAELHGLKEQVDRALADGYDGRDAERDAERVEQRFTEVKRWLELDGQQLLAHDRRLSKLEAE